ncbi:MAG: phosphoribosyltransferase family protein, partial [bacterium]|nr:phosphoribosyltransferase family protein [bacterium]
MFAHERQGVEIVTHHHGEKCWIPHLRVSWPAYFALIDELITRVADDPPNQIVAITFGGILPARALSEALGTPLAYLGAEGYDAAASGDRRKMRAADGILFTRQLLKTHPGFGSDVLVVDDLTDAGRTFTKCVGWLKRSPKYGDGIVRMRSACLWKKSGTKFIPDCT